MCGITGYIGKRSAVGTAITNLKRLEYRGYDSSGVAYAVDGGLHIIKAAGKIANLELQLNGSREIGSTVAVAHTRWATHGLPNFENAHPHRDCTGRIALVHNGIVENYVELRRELLERGHEFVSETDTEVLAHLIEGYLGEGLISEERFVKAARTALKRVSGSYAIAVISPLLPDAVFVARKDSPLVIGLGEGENFVASDIPAVLAWTRQVVVLEDGDCAVVKATSLRLFNLDGADVARGVLNVTWDDAAAEKGGYEHFMLKEIYEGPRTLRDTLRGRITEDDRVVLRDVAFTPQAWANISRVSIVACGTAYHAGVVAKRLFEQLLRRPVEATVASEYRYSDPLVDAQTLVVLISQSGETADTLAALRESRKKGAATLAVVNVVGSTLAREADAVLYTQAGPEIGVASTKAYLAQLAALSLLGIYLAQDHGLDEKTRRELVQGLRALPQQVEMCLERAPIVEELSRKLADSSCFFYLGRGYDYASALEAALKLKEISYIHAEAYPAGEMKHGPLALVEPGVAVVGFSTQPATHDKMLSNIKEVKARNGTVVAVVCDCDITPDGADYEVRVPTAPPALMPVLVMVPMQLMAYYVAYHKGCSIDQPRNLAKSVTVE